MFCIIPFYAITFLIQTTVSISDMVYGWLNFSFQIMTQFDIIDEPD